MRRILPAILGFFAIFLTTAFIFRTETKNVSAALATHLVISEVQIAGANGTNDEFVELYNPTDSNVDLSGWRLTRKTSGGTQSTLVNSITGAIPSHGYFLIAHSASYSGTVSPDIMYSAPSQNIAINNSVVLYSDAGVTQVDLVGMGSATATETAATSNPAASTSVERKANSSSGSTSMGIGGSDEFSGNGEDTNDNAADFVGRAVSQPQNSQSSIEPPIVSPSPTPSVTPTPSPTEEPSPSPTPTAEPSASPTPTLTIEPTPTPTVEPTPTLIPTPTIPAPRLLFRGPNISCSLNYKVVRFFRSNIFWPFLTCSRT